MKKTNIRKLVFAGIALGLGLIFVRQVCYQLGHYESGYVKDLSELPGVGQEFADLKAKGLVYFRIFHTIHDRHTFIVSGTLVSKESLLSFCRRKGIYSISEFDNYGLMNIKETCKDMGGDPISCFTEFTKSDIMISGVDKRLKNFFMGYRPGNSRFTMLFEVHNEEPDSR